MSYGGVIWRRHVEVKPDVMWRCSKVIVYGGVIWCHMEV